MPNTTSTGNAFLSGSMSSLKSRRPSMLTSSNASVHSTHLSGANTSGILQQLGTGVVSGRLFLIFHLKTNLLQFVHFF